MKQFVDLHIHSRYSDGMYYPTELVTMAAESGLKAISIADHDSVAGLDEALMAGASMGVEVIPAVELSVEFRNYHDIHLLGYCIEYHDADFSGKLNDFCQRRDERVKAIIEKINTKLASEKKGSIRYEEVLESAEGALGRPHIARELIGKGYVTTMQDAFTKYLLPCNVPKLYFPVSEALGEIKRINGVAVLAHPTTISDNASELRTIISELVTLGLAGIEVYNSMSSSADVAMLERFAREFGLMMTGGSDFHGIEDDIKIGSGRGSLAVPYQLVTALKERCGKTYNKPAH